MYHDLSRLLAHVNEHNERLNTFRAKANHVWREYRLRNPKFGICNSIRQRHPKSSDKVNLSWLWILDVAGASPFGSSSGTAHWFLEPGKSDSCVAVLIEPLAMFQGQWLPDFWTLVIRQVVGFLAARWGSE